MPFNQLFRWSPNEYLFEHVVQHGYPRCKDFLNWWLGNTEDICNLSLKQTQSKANPAILSQTQQIKVAAFCGQVYPCQCSPLETINEKNAFTFSNIVVILLLTINNHMLNKYTAQAGEKAPQWCKYFFILQNRLSLWLSLYLQMYLKDR